MSSRRRFTTRYPGIRFRLLDDDRPDGPRRYVIGYTDANGAYHTETLPVGTTLDDARTRKASLEGVRKHYVPTKMTVGDLLDGYLDSRRHSLKPSTVENYDWAVTHLKDAFGHTQVDRLSPTHIASLIDTLQRNGFKSWTIKKILTPLIGALRVALREGWISSNPADRLLPHERPKADQKDMRCLPAADIQTLLGHASSDRWKSLFALLAFTGLRISEALALTWDDVGQDTVVVRTSKTKAGERSVMLIPRVARQLTKHRLQQAPGTAFVFANRNGDPVSRREALRALRAAEKAGGLPNYTLHELRHTFASILISQGENVALVADQMGHADPSITLKAYAKLFDAQKNVDQARERLQAAMGTV